MAVPVVTVATVTGNTGTISPGSSTSALYTCPASTIARICYAKTSFGGFGLEVNDRYVISGMLSGLDVKEQYIYLEAGDTIKLINKEISSRDADYFFSLLEQT